MSGWSRVSCYRGRVARTRVAAWSCSRCFRGEVKQRPIAALVSGGVPASCRGQGRGEPQTICGRSTARIALHASTRHYLARHLPDRDTLVRGQYVGTRPEVTVLNLLTLDPGYTSHPSHRPLGSDSVATRAPALARQVRHLRLIQVVRPGRTPGDSGPRARA